MFTLRAQAQALMRMPAGEGTTEGTTAGPTFEYVQPELRRWNVSEDERIVVLRNGP